MQTTRVALLQRERLIASEQYFVRDLRRSRDIAVPIALRQLAAEGLTPALKQEAPFDATQLRAIARVYQALSAEARRGSARPAACAATVAADERPEPAPPARKAPPPPACVARRRQDTAPWPAARGSDDRRLSAAVTAVTRPCLSPAEFSPSESWRALPRSPRDLVSWPRLMASGVAAMIVTTVLVLSAITLRF